MVLGTRPPFAAGFILVLNPHGIGSTNPSKTALGIPFFATKTDSQGPKPIKRVYLFQECHYVMPFWSFLGEFQQNEETPFKTTGILDPRWNFSKKDLPSSFICSYPPPTWFLSWFWSCNCLHHKEKCQITSGNTGGRRMDIGCSVKTCRSRHSFKHTSMHVRYFHEMCHCSSFKELLSN